jgi:hypothetical protein
MTRAAITAEQRAAYKSRAERVQSVIQEIEWLESSLADARESKLSIVEWLRTQNLLGNSIIRHVFEAGMAARMAQLEQELADLDRPKALPPNARLEDRLDAFHGIVRGQVTPKQIERYPVIDRNPIPSTQTRCIHYAGPHELVSKRHHDACCCSQCIWNDTADALPIPATLADESHAEASV